MNLGAIVEVAIGLIFVWIVLSLTIIQIQEWINVRLDKRARDMEEAIHEMLANPNLKAQFYDHPVIRGLTSKKRKEPSSVFFSFFLQEDYKTIHLREKNKWPPGTYFPSETVAVPAMFARSVIEGFSKTPPIP